MAPLQYKIFSVTLTRSEEGKTTRGGYVSPPPPHPPKFCGQQFSARWKKGTKREEIGKKKRGGGELAKMLPIFPTFLSTFSLRAGGRSSVVDLALYSKKCSYDLYVKFLIIADTPMNLFPKNLVYIYLYIYIYIYSVFHKCFGLFLTYEPKL